MASKVFLRGGLDGLYGDVHGTITLSDSNLFKCHEMPQFNYKGIEHMQKLSSQVYDVYGSVISNDEVILQWQYQLERLETTVPDA